ncbi:17416_t:CDS:2, partial [Gigaspora margarita]
NMYLAEDRILSFELVIKKNESWKLQYIKSTTSNPTTDPFNGHGDNLFDAARSLYFVIIVIIFICSIAVPPLDFSNPLKIQEALKNAAFCDIVISVALTYLLYLFLSFIYCEPWHMLTCLVQYLLLVPSYVNILIIYAFCNTYDVSWGTKEDDKDAAYGNIIDELKIKSMTRNNTAMLLLRKMIIIDSKNLDVEFPLVLTSDKKSDQKILRRNYIGKNLDVEFPLVLTSNKKCDKKRLRRNYMAKNLDVKFPLVLTSNKKCDQKRKLHTESEHR